MHVRFYFYFSVLDLVAFGSSKLDGMVVWVYLFGLLTTYLWLNWIVLLLHIMDIFLSYDTCFFYIFGLLYFVIISS